MEPRRRWRVAKTGAVRYIRGMKPSEGHPPTHPDPSGSPDGSGDPAIEPCQPRNLFLLAAHQIMLRLGWIFKTESVIMPFFVDAMTGGLGWIRGCLPVLNRLGQGVAPLFAAGYLKAMRQKKRALLGFTLLMALPFLALSLTWFAVGGEKRIWMPWLFLTLYFAFFVLYGLYLVSFGTVQGKLIRPNRRGYLILLSTFWGAIPATLVALWLMPGWLDPASPRWGHVFAFVGVCFFLSGLIALLLFEPRDEAAEPPLEPPGSLDDRRPARAPVRATLGVLAGSLAETRHALRQDANLRRLVLVAVLFGSGLIIVPHYQALAREQLHSQPPKEIRAEARALSGKHLMVWVVTQNAAVAVFSLFVGPLADRRGYRLTMRLMIFASAIAPACAILLPQLPKNVGAGLFWLVYVALGVTPLVPRMLLNYALEICKPDAHPRYQSIVGLGMALPFLVSPAVGWLVDTRRGPLGSCGFQVVFLGAVALVVISGWLTFGLDEPRHKLRDAEAGGAELGTPE